jgi:hypothetical protein
MDIVEFRDLVRIARSSVPTFFEFPEANNMVDKVSLADIEETELLLGAKLPDEYCQFVLEFGAGFFGSAVDIYSPKRGGYIYIVESQPIVESHPIEDSQGFIAFSGNGCGDFYGFRVVNAKCESRVVFWSFDDGGELFDTPYNDLYEFVSDELRRHFP